MNIQELNFLAYGPFKEKLLDFSGKSTGLHIIYGPNEAGKSSALRGLKGLLYGIPTRTNDNFLHENKLLRIAGTLVNDSGERLELVRRKGNAKTLLDAAGEPLDEAVLSRMMQGVSADVFDSLFGIDHEALVLGGREILNQKGEVGQALFSASLGSTSLHQVLGALEEEAAALFRPAGSRQEINALIRDYTDIQKEIRAISLSSKDWERKDEDLRNTTKALNELVEQLGRLKAQLTRLQRARRASPKFAQRRDLLVRIMELDGVVVLAEDFEARRKKMFSDRDKAATTASNGATSLKSLEGQLEETKVNQPLLEARQEIELLHSRLGGHTKAMRDRPGIDAQRNQLQADAANLLGGISPDITLEQAETLRPVLKKRPRITELGNSRNLLFDNLERARKDQRETDTSLGELREALEAMAETRAPDRLEAQVVLARKQGELDAVIQEKEESLAATERRWADFLATLSPAWGGGFSDVEAAVFPRKESIEKYIKHYADIDRKETGIREREVETTRRLSDVQRQLDEIEHGGAVPNETELDSIRTQREKGWLLLRRQWMEGKNVASEAADFDPDRELPEAFEHRVGEADEIADRLRREASRVQSQATLIAEKAQCEAELERMRTSIEECCTDQQHLDDEWQVLWQGVDVVPLTPLEMKAWREDMQTLWDALTELNQERLQLESRNNKRTSLIGGLRDELAGLEIGLPEDSGLEAALVIAESTAEKLSASVRQREALVENIDRLEKKLEDVKTQVKDAEEASRDWSSRWQEVVSNLGLGADALPAEVDLTMQDLVALFEKIAKMKELDARIEGIDRDAETLEREASRLVQRVSPEHADLPVGELIGVLKHALDASVEQDSTRRAIEKQIGETKQIGEAAREALKNLDQALQQLCKEAACDSPDDLEAAESNSRALTSSTAELAALDKELLEIGEGLSLDELDVQVKEVDPDTLTGDIDQLTNVIEQELEPQQPALAELKGQQSSELRQMDGKDDAAALAERGQLLLEGIRSRAARYTRVKLAARVLRDEIERYRQENQGPLIERASEYFASLTRESFSGVKTDYDESDEAVLVGVRPDESRVSVDGMSSGTRDQLYLSLRLASIEKYLHGAEAMPFIVDNILVHFDDDRSSAALGVLAEFAQKTQVIMFTHHRRLVEQVQAMAEAAQVRVHELGA